MSLRSRLMPLPSQPELRRRLKAARALAGFKSTAALAAAMPQGSGLGDRTLRKLEGGEAEIRSPALREIAAACGLPYEFFTIDFTELTDAVPLGTTDADPGRDERNIARRLDDLEHDLARRMDSLEDDLRAVLRMASSWPTAAPPGVPAPARPTSRSSEPTRERSSRQEGRDAPRGTER